MRFRLIRSVVVLSALLSMTGCGNSPGPEVRGTVTLDGQPLPDAEVLFAPSGGDATRPGALVKTNAEGKFQIVPDEETGETLQPGAYKVVVSKKVNREGKVPVDIEGDMEQMEAAGLVRELLPPRYSRETDTTLAAEIKPEPNDLKFELTTK